MIVKLPCKTLMSKVPSPLVNNILSDGATQVNIWRTLEHAKQGCLGLSGKQREYSEHTTSTDVVTVNEPKSIRDRIPHSLDTCACATFGHEPI